MIYGDPLKVRRMVCGHPLAARAVRDFDGVMFTACWACEVEHETGTIRAQNDGLSGKIDAAGVSGNHDSATMRSARSSVLTPPETAPFVSPGVRR